MCARQTPNSKVKDGQSETVTNKNNNNNPPAHSFSMFSPSSACGKNIIYIYIYRGLSKNGYTQTRWFRTTFAMVFSQVLSLISGQTMTNPDSLTRNNQILIVGSSDEMLERHCIRQRRRCGLPCLCWLLMRQRSFLFSPCEIGPKT